MRRRYGLGLFANRGEQALVVPGLLDEIAGAAAHGFDREVDAAPGGHHDHGRGVALRFEAGQQVHAFLAGGGVARVVEVGQDQIEVVRRGPLRSSARGESTVTAFAALAFEQEPQGFQHVGLIVADQHAIRFQFRFHRTSTW